MSFVTVQEDHEGRQMTVDDKGVFTYRRRLYFVTDNVFDGPDTLRLYPGFPTIGSMYASGYDSNPWAFCKSIQVKPRDNDRLVWDVDIEYSTAFDPAGPIDNPLLRPPQISWQFAQFTRPAIVDNDNHPVVNSSREYFDPPIEIDDSRPVLTITRNEASFSPALVIQYKDAVNSDSWFGTSPRQAKMQNISANYRFENGYEYWEITYEIQFNPDTWNLKPIDRGYHTRSGSSGWKHILDSNGQKITQPKWLDGSGNVNTSSTPVFLDFEVYREVSFGALNLV